MHHGPVSLTVQAPLGRIPVFYREGSRFTELFREIGQADGVPQSRKKK